MHPYEHLSREERIRRIGEILAKGIYLMALRDQAKNTAVVDVAARGEVPDSDWITRGILDFLQRVGWAAPREIRRNLDVAPRTFARRLRLLVARGALESRGFTSGAQYRIRVIQASRSCELRSPV